MWDSKRDVFGFKTYELSSCITVFNLICSLRRAWVELGCRITLPLLQVQWVCGSQRQHVTHLFSSNGNTYTHPHSLGCFSLDSRFLVRFGGICGDRHRPNKCFCKLTVVLFLNSVFSMCLDTFLTICLIDVLTNAQLCVTTEKGPSQTFALKVQYYSCLDLSSPEGLMGYVLLQIARDVLKCSEI